jgi:hypothetical protein
MTGELPPAVQAAAELDGLAGWLEDELAGGKPPKYLVHIAILAVRWIAGRLRVGGAS